MTAVSPHPIDSPLPQPLPPSRETNLALPQLHLGYTPIRELNQHTLRQPTPTFLQPRFEPYRHSGADFQKRKLVQFFINCEKNFACIAELLFDIARYTSGWNEKFTYDPKNPESYVNAKCKNFKEGVFCKCYFETCSDAYVYILKALTRELKKRLVENFTTTNLPWTSVILQLGNFQNPIYKVFESVGYDIHYTHNFLLPLNLTLTVDKFLSVVEIKTSSGINLSINLFTFRSSSIKYANMLGAFGA